MSPDRSSRISSGSSSDFDDSDHESSDDGSDASECSIYTKKNLRRWLMRDLLGCLQNVKATGSFATYFSYPAAPNPALTIEGLDTIGLPLSIRDAKAIIDISRQAPFGKGDETLVDTSVRKTWELDASQFTLLNPGWEGFLGLQVKFVAENLGIDVEPKQIRAEPYKLLLYEEGAFFKPHKDSEKTPGMFGTLVIALPSKHAGGLAKVTHNGLQLELDTAPNSQFNTTTLAWYADVTHEILPVTSGCRLVLTYNLVVDSPTTAVKTARDLDYRDNLLRTYLSKVQRRPLGPGDQWNNLNQLIYVLHHQYTANSLSLANLKGQDSVVGRYLDRNCGAEEFHLFLAQLNHTYTEQYYEYYGSDDEDENETCIKNIVLPDGTKIGERMEIHEEDILQDNPFSGTADDIDEGEYTGNESMPSTHRYYRSVAILVSNYSLPRFMSEMIADDTNIQKEVDFVCKHVAPYAKAGYYRSDLTTFLGKQLARAGIEEVSYSWPRNIDDESTASIVSICFRINQDGVVQEWLNQKAKFLPSKARQTISDHVVRGYSPSLPNWDWWFQGFLSRISTFKRLVDEIEGFKEALISATGSEKSPFVVSYLGWAKDQVDKKLEVTSKQKLDINDVSSPMRLATWMGTNWLLEKFVPYIETLKSQVFNTAFLIQLRKLQQSHGISEQEVVSMFQKILSKCPVRLVWSRVGTPEPSHAANVATLIGDCLFLGLGNEACATIDQAGDDAVRHDLTPAYTVKFLDALFLALPGDIQDVDRVVLRCLVERLIGKIIVDTHHEKPQGQRGWAMKPRGKPDCCGDCTSLNKFLEDPSQQIGSFTINGERRKHLQYKLEPRYHTCTIDKSGSTHTLVITKKNVASEYQDDLKQWQEKFQSVKDTVGSLRGKRIMDLLGEQYEALMDLCLDAVPPELMEKLAPKRPKLARAKHSWMNEPSASMATSRSALIGRPNPPGRSGTKVAAGTKRKAGDGDGEDEQNAYKKQEVSASDTSAQLAQVPAKSTMQPEIIDLCDD